MFLYFDIVNAGRTVVRLIVHAIGSSINCYKENQKLSTGLLSSKIGADGECLSLREQMALSGKEVLTQGH